MKQFKKQAAQGDMLITKIDKLPPDLLPMEENDDGHFIIAHSETGHNHVVLAENAHAYQAANDPFVMYLVVNKETTLEHLRSFDTHHPIEIAPGTYRINRQREYTSEGFRRAAD